MTFKKAVRLFRKSGYEGIIHTTPSHKHKSFKLLEKDSKGRDLFSPIYELSRIRVLTNAEPFSKELLPAAQSLIRRTVFAEHEGIDKGGSDPERCYIAFSCPESRAELVESVYVPGQRLILVEIEAEHERIKLEKQKKKSPCANKKRFDKSIAKIERWMEEHEVEVNKTKGEDDRRVYEIYCLYSEHDNPHFPMVR